MLLIIGILYILFSILFQCDLSLRWAGWSDSLAGIELYELAIYKMKPFGYKLTHNGETALVRETLNDTTEVYNTTLVDPGKYVFNIILYNIYSFKHAQMYLTEEKTLVTKRLVVA